MASIRLLALCPLLLLCACATRRPEWREIATQVASFEDVWNAVTGKAELNGYIPENAGDEATDRGMRVFHSKWITREYGFRQSFRRRMHATFDADPKQDGAWRIKLRVERQTVADIARSMQPEESDWKDDGQDRDVEDRIAAQIRLHLGGALRDQNR